MKRICAALENYNANTKYANTEDCVKHSLSLAYGDSKDPYVIFYDETISELKDNVSMYLKNYSRFGYDY